VDFIIGLSKTTKHHDAITTNQLADLYIKEVVRLHGMPLTIFSDHDTKFASKF